MPRPSDLTHLYGNLPPGIRANIIRLNIIKFSKWFMLVMPLIVPFYEENGMNLTQIMTLKSVYSIVVVILELPSGYMADVIGRKKTLVAGAFLATAGFIVYSLSSSFHGFLFAEVALGAGASFISGADSAMLYDTLASGRRQGEYTRYEGINASVGNFSEAFAGLAGGALAMISLRMPFYFQVAVAATAIPASLLLKEPDKRNRISAVITGKDLADTVRKIFFSQNELRFNLILSSVIGAATLITAWFAQPLFSEAGIPLALYGIIWTALNLTVGFSSAIAHIIEKKLGEARTLILLVAAIPLLMVITAFLPGWYILPALFALYLVRGVATPVLKDYVNRQTTPEVRATVMSLRDLIIRVMFAVLAPMAGRISDRHSLSSGLIITGLVILVISLLTLAFFNRRRRWS